MKASSSLAAATFFVGVILSSSTAFTPSNCYYQVIRRSHHDWSSNDNVNHRLSMSNEDVNKNNNEENESGNPEPHNNKSDNKNENQDQQQQNQRNENENENQYLDEISWRVAKLRLEEANTQRFLKRKPLKLDYETSRRWIQMNWAPKTKEEFYDLVANGNLRTPYISKRPEEYYGERGEWISWDHYLLGSLEDDFENGRNGTDDGRKDKLMKWQ